jgi:hypothetical protein
LRHVVAVVLFAAAVTPAPAWAVGCDDKVGHTVQIAGSYVPSKQAYARTFIFAMVWDCDGTKEIVTVQRPTGNLPVCGAQEEVEVVGKLVWNKTLVDGHFEINGPSSVTCRPTKVAVPRGPEQRQSAQAPPPQTPPQQAPVQTGPSVQTEPLRAQARSLGTSVWVGRYQDSRGVGDVSFTLVRGESTVSGTWKLRTGGGGPVTGLLEAGGRRMQLRMENIAPECPGIFEGSAELTDTNLVASYSGKDCEGVVTGGRLELRVQ